MPSRSDKGGVVVAIASLLILLLSLAGAAVYFVVSRQQMAAAMEVERAQVAVAQARIIAAEAQLRADAPAKRPSLSNEEPPLGGRDSIRAAVERVLRTQEDAWNEGDVEAFMEHYWKSDELTFSADGKTTRGWAATLNRYRERYPTPEQMGRLTLSDLEITPLGVAAALVLGQWSLERESDPVSGNFTLVLRKFDDRWLIVHDHTSRATGE